MAVEVLQRRLWRERSRSLLGPPFCCTALGWEGKKSHHFFSTPQSIRASQLIYLFIYLFCLVSWGLEIVYDLEEIHSLRCFCVQVVPCLVSGSRAEMDMFHLHHPLHVFQRLSPTGKDFCMLPNSHQVFRCDSSSIQCLSVTFPLKPPRV